MSQSTPPFPPTHLALCLRRHNGRDITGNGPAPRRQFVPRSLRLRRHSAPLTAIWTIAESCLEECPSPADTPTRSRDTQPLVEESATPTATPTPNSPSQSPSTMTSSLSPASLAGGGTPSSGAAWTPHKIVVFPETTQVAYYTPQAPPLSPFPPPPPPPPTQPLRISPTTSAPCGSFSPSPYSASTSSPAVYSSSLVPDPPSSSSLSSSSSSSAAAATATSAVPPSTRDVFGATNNSAWSCRTPPVVVNDAMGALASNGPVNNTSGASADSNLPLTCDVLERI